ncbi:MAG: coiled-coil domain-containing protein [Mycobacterium sp.]
MKFALKPVTGVIAGITVLGLVCSGAAYADPAQDEVAKFSELAQQSEQLAESVNSARLDLDKKLQLLADLDKQHAANLVALDAANAQLAPHQDAVNKLAAAVYTGGHSDSVSAILTAASPQSLIDTLDIQRVMATGMTADLQSFRRVRDDAAALEAESAKSEADTQAAVDAAVALRTDLQKKQSELRSQIASAKVRYALLPSAERAALPTSVVAALGPIGNIPTVGMGGLVPNARSLAAYIMATYPGVQSIGGVRADYLPDHPSGHAIDIMIGSDMGLGDAINADVQSHAADFGVSYTMWRVANHFNHVHVTVF